MKKMVMMMKTTKTTAAMATVAEAAGDQFTSTPGCPDIRASPIPGHKKNNVPF